MDTQAYDFKTKLRLYHKFSLIFLTIFVFFLFNAVFPSLQTLQNAQNYFYLEELGLQLLSAFIIALLSVNAFTPLTATPYSVLLGASLGLVYFTYTLGYKILDPTQIQWALHGDWEFSFMGWQFFRQEAWQFPPGKINGFFYPVGSSIGYTDSIPLLGFFFKLWRMWLPTDFQYLGVWLCSCFVLQGIFAAKLLRLVTPNLLIQALGISFFVLSPILLNRVWHAALCAHWLILAGLWLYFTPWQREKMRLAGGAWLLLLVLAGLIHPYLVIMVLGLLAAFYLRMFWIEAFLSWQQTALHLFSLGSALLLTWWMSGYFIIKHANMNGFPLGYYSLNLLAPFNAAGWSVFIRGLPAVTDGQIFEGFAYLGLGVFILLLWVIYELSQRIPQQRSYRQLLPLGLGCLALTLLAVSNKVTVGDVTLFELDNNNILLKILTPFQSSGRFFWVAYYAMLLLAMFTLIKRQRERFVMGCFALALTLQGLDLSVVINSFRERHWHENLRQDGLQSPVWEQAAEHYRHITLLMPPACGYEAAPYVPFAELARKHKLTLNTGRAARFNSEETAVYCQELGKIVEKGMVSDEDIYIVHSHYLAQFQKNAQPTVLCGVLDGFNACVTAQSYQRWAAP